MRHRRPVELAGGDLHVLAAQGRDHVVRGQIERLQPVGIEPDLHGIVAGAENGQRAHPLDAGEHVGDFQVGVVRHEQRAARIVRRIEVHHRQDVGRALIDGDADLLHRRRQPRDGGGDAVLHLHLRGIEIGADVEGDGDVELAIGGRVRGDVEHALDTVHRLFDRRHHGVGDGLGAGAGVLAGDGDGRRRDLGILRDRQTDERHPAQDHDHDRDDGGEDRPVDEEMRNAHDARFSPPVRAWMAWRSLPASLSARRSVPWR